MATKKTVKKSEPKKKKTKVEKVPAVSADAVLEKEEKKEKNVLGKYFYAVGRRKTSIAQIRLFVSDTKESSVEINGKKIDAYFNLARLQAVAMDSFSVAGDKKFTVLVHVAGGGVTGQAEAIRLGIARALVKFNEELKKPLKDLGFLTRDSRVVERKKPGKKKARRSPQWAKR